MTGLAGTVAAGAVAVAVFVVPGFVVARLLGVRAPLGSALALWFALSLALLSLAFVAALASSLSIAGGAAVTLALVAIAALAAPRSPSAVTHLFDEAPAVRRDPSEPRWWAPTAILLVAAAALAATWFAPVGSVDRWWYLAYVRHYAEAPVLDLAEPFLGTGEAFARFGPNPWLFALAIVSALTGSDPVFVYERIAPSLAAAACLSAAHGLATALFGAGARLRLSVAATALLWCGGLLPVLARAGEDKILAQAALVPLACALFLDVARTTSRAHKRRRTMAFACVAMATAAMHALAYALLLAALAALVAALALLRRGEAKRVRIAFATACVIAIAPAMVGGVVERRLDDIGAVASRSDHPVVRVHEGRDRLLDLGGGARIVRPSLLAHPLTPLAALGLLAALVAIGRRTTAPIPNREQLAATFVASTTVAALAVAFLPVLVAVASRLLPPWMVYRVLWIVPVAPLAAIGADTVRARLGWRETTAMALVLALSLPVVAATVLERGGAARARLAIPASESFSELIAALAALDPSSVIVAAPELAERIPALTGRRVLAGLDRSTVVFSGSRAQGERRLRLRAELLRGERLSGPSSPLRASATHAVFDPRAARRPRCARTLHSNGGYALCELARDDEEPLASIAVSPRAAADSGKGSPAETTRRDGAARLARKNPWSAAPAIFLRTFELAPGARPEQLAIALALGRAADEAAVRVRCSVATGEVVYETRLVTRVGAGDSIRLDLPGLPCTRVDLEVASNFLPSLTVRDVALL